MFDSYRGLFLSLNYKGLSNVMNYLKVQVKLLYCLIHFNTNDRPERNFAFLEDQSLSKQRRLITSQEKTRTVTI